jgi:hypothetical protein
MSKRGAFYPNSLVGEQIHIMKFLIDSDIMMPGCRYEHEYEYEHEHGRP